VSKTVVAGVATPAHSKASGVAAMQAVESLTLQSRIGMVAGMVAIRTAAA